MKRVLIAIVLLTGCSTEDETRWSVELGVDGAEPNCIGTMTLRPTTETPFNLDGDWECYPFAGAVTGELRDDGMIFLHMETSPGQLNQVRGRLGDREIAGEILLNVNVPFSATQR